MQKAKHEKYRFDKNEEFFRDDTLITSLLICSDHGCKIEESFSKLKSLPKLQEHLVNVQNKDSLQDIIDQEIKGIDIKKQNKREFKR